MTAISVSERLLEMAAFYTWLDFTLTYKVLFTISFDGYDLSRVFFHAVTHKASGGS